MVLTSILLSRWSPTRIQDHLRYHCVFILIAGLCCGFGQRSVNPWSLMDAHPGLAALVKSCLISAAVSECHDGGFSCFHEITNSSQYLTDLVVLRLALWTLNPAIAVQIRARSFFYVGRSQKGRSHSCADMHSISCHDLHLHWLVRSCSAITADARVIWGGCGRGRTSSRCLMRIRPGSWAIGCSAHELSPHGGGGAQGGGWEGRGLC